MQRFDVAVIGAGAAGMMCAAVAGQRGHKVVLIDHSPAAGEKIRISGGGRCNFTNRDAGPENFLSDNPRFCRSALSGFTAADFVAMVRRHGIGFHEKHRGQLFCDRSSTDILDMLGAECGTGRVAWRLGSAVRHVRDEGTGFRLDTEAGTVVARSLVIATGGLSIPKIGASDFGYRIARQYGLRIVETRPGLVPLTFDAEFSRDFGALAGLSLEVDAYCKGPYGRATFREDLLFTHRGVSGPAILQISSHWRPGGEIRLDLAPSVDWQILIQEKANQKQQPAAVLAQWLPRRLAEAWVKRVLTASEAQRPFGDISDKSLRRLGAAVAEWDFVPAGSEGYRKAEVTVGGVDTRGLSSKTMEANARPGLYFIGEVVDVTGWLGGYNFQWAWSSAVACARALPESSRPLSG